MAQEEPTIGECAARAAEALGLKERIMFTTGRVLVKELYENMAMPDPDEIGSSATYGEYTAQYIVPEVHALGRAGMRLALKLWPQAKGSLFAARVLRLNEAARDNSIAVAIYDRSGRVE